jgi:hypothetical protein
MSITAAHQHLLPVATGRTGAATGSASTLTNDSVVESTAHVPPFYALCYIMKPPAKDTTVWRPPAGLDPSGRVIALNQQLATLRSSVNTTASNAVPEGLIAYWSKLTEAVPMGWVACDGSNTTPDLRGRFVLGATSAGDLGEVGGMDEHAHTNHAHQHRVTVPNHAHAVPSLSLNTALAGAHSHEMGRVIGAHLSEVGNDRYETASLLDHTHMVSTAGGHVHALVLPPTSTAREEAASWTGLMDSSLRPREHLPPHQRLLALMKTKPSPAKPSVTLAPSGSSSSQRIDALEAAVSDLSRALAQAVPDSIPPRMIAVGQSMTWTVALAGLRTNLEAKAEIGRYYLSKDDAYSPYSDRVLGTLRFDPAGLKAGSYTADPTVVRPEVPPGSYYVIVHIERNKMMPGSTETKILRSAQIEVRVPDLAPFALDAPAVADTGQHVIATWTVTNRGNARSAWLVTGPAPFVTRPHL